VDEVIVSEQCEFGGVGGGWHAQGRDTQLGQQRGERIGLRPSGGAAPSTGTDGSFGPELEAADDHW
jgi:hypothetical protein